MQGVRNRTTLIKGDDGSWYVVELCEPLQSLIDMSAEFYGYSGAREVLTFVTEGEKSPGSMGVSMREDAADLPAVERQDDADQQDPDAIAPEDEVRGRDIGNQDSLMPSADGREIPADRVVVNAADFEKVIVNGVELAAESSLAALRSGCSFYGISQSGGKMKCYGRLVNHLQKLELELLRDAAQHAAAELERKPHSPTLAVPPSEEAQRQHELTHTYQPWCESCVCFKARANRQLRDDSSRASETPTVSLDLAFTRSIPEGANPQDVSALPFLVMVASASGYVGCVPLRSKGQFELLTHEVLSFTAGLGHAEVIFRCDNEPTMRQVLKYVVSTRLSMGLATRSVTPPAYSHGNSLVENVIGRLRPLASILMHSVRKRTGMDFSTNHALWTWAHRHAAWLMNRYGVVRNVTPFELVHKKRYTGSIAQFAEPVFGYFRIGAKGTAKWRRALFLGKVDGQDSFLLYSGSHLVLTRSIRRIDTDWKGHLAFYSTFKCNSWEYKSGFGGRVVPTKIKREALSVGFQLPQGEIEPSAFHDADAEAVREKAREELREESERVEMGAHDDRHELPAVEDDAPPEVSFGDSDAVQHDDETVEVGDDVEADTGGVPAPSLGVAGSEAPVTPIFDDQGPMEVAYVPQTPRASPTTRAHGDEDVDIEEHQAKRARGDDPKCSRLQRITQEYASRISTVEFGNEKFHTMDSYENDQDMEQQGDSADLWADEDSLHFKDVPEDLWSDYNMERQPDEPPEWVDMLANEVEISRLLDMKVLIKEEFFQSEVRDSLTTKFVHDWRAKDHTLDDGSTTKRWLRRSRLVARHQLK